ncbi:putative S-adenosyl-L-methionine-dependent methyltransferase [Planotetraspora thailandica]|uniref:S-adenosyl-L-methionine-dependent methyltransferase n=1 Tax=Planotetraspora thailandica TaxID=487172 RepID=A0A8J3UXM2_9ACTN|nr:SAM-dependent methyltransferase [Planotetraspora thailandica]GII52736.1 putative S-adenosyl-L-methionine-dependent methyltransferase [Planotetraspora thailandica]
MYDPESRPAREGVRATTSTLPTGVGITALITAYARAQESRRRDALFVDPLAESFVVSAVGTAAGTGDALPRLGPARDDGSSALWTSLCAYLAGRTPFYDRYLVQALADGRRQVVMLGAGLDTRAFRLPLAAGTIVYEVDTPAVLDFKARVLAKHEPTSAAERVLVAIDLQEDWVGALRQAGFDSGRPTVWLVEGLLMYLTAPQADALMAAISAISAPGSVFAAEYLNRRSRMDDVPISDSGDRAVAELLTSSDQGGPGVEPEAWLSRHGWVARRRDLVEEMADLGRPVPVLFDTDRSDPLRSWLFTAALTAVGDVDEDAPTETRDSAP